MQALMRSIGYWTAFGTDRHGRVLGLSFADILIQGLAAIFLIFLAGLFA